MTDKVDIIKKYLLLIFALLSMQDFLFAEDKELKFMTFNIWQEGTAVSNGMDKILNVIILANPDVVCFTEVRNYNNESFTTKIVERLAESGLFFYGGYAGGDVSIISKYPVVTGEKIFSNKGTVANFSINIEGNAILVSAAHLDYNYYASYLPRGYCGGDPNWKMIGKGSGKPNPVTNIDSLTTYNLKSTRDEAVSAFLASVRGISDPVILMGDFNEPSWLDWTDKTRNLFDHNGVVIKWQTTHQLFSEGFTDAYRAFHENELKNPGFTWPAYAHGNKSTSWTPNADERERIDYIFFKGDGVRVINTALVGPKECYVYDKLDTSYSENEFFIADELDWPSDHKAVFAILGFTFD